MITTYLVLKIALKAVVDEANRLAAEAENQAEADALKSRIAQLEVDLARGAIDQNTYAELASKILAEVGPPQSGEPHQDGGR